MRLYQYFLLFIVSFFISEAYGSIRVISLSPNTTEIVHELIQLSDQDKTLLVGTIYYPSQPSYYNNILSIGSYQGINVEAILKLHPTVVVTWKNQTPPQILALLKRFGIKVAIFNAESLIELANSFTQIAKLVSLEKEGIALKTKFKSQLQKIVQNANQSKDKAENINTQQSPRVFLQLSQQPIFSIGGMGILNDIIHVCRGENIFDHVQKTSFQTVLSAVIKENPDVIIMLSSVAMSKAYQTVTSSMWQNWPVINAVKEKRVYLLSSSVISQFSPKIITGVNAVCSILHTN